MMDQNVIYICDDGCTLNCTVSDGTTVDNNGLIDGVTFDVNIPGNAVLVYDGNQLQWVPAIAENIEERKNPMENFIEHFDICGPGGAIIESILKKKHSERTEEEKETIRNLMRGDKREKPKIKISNELYPMGQVQGIDLFMM